MLSTSKSNLFKIKNIPKELNIVRNRCLALFGECFIDPFLNDLFIRRKDNELIPLHFDPTMNGFRHIRINIMLQKPNIGGDIIDGNKTIILNESDAYIIETSILHGLTLVKGSKDLMILSFGLQISNDDKSINSLLS
jgi:hypothetical protein